MKDNYLIIEAYTDANIGSGALVENTLKLLKENLGVKSDNIRIMAHYPSIFEQKYKVDSVKDIFNFPFNQGKLNQLSWLFRTVLWMSYAWFFPSKAICKKRWKDYDWADVIVSVGAERINDKYIKNEYFSLFTYGIVKKFGKKMVLAPSTYGPFLHSFTKKHAAYIFKKLDLVYCRDLRSFDTVLGFPGIDASKIINTSDVAIVQEWDSDYKQKYFTDDKPIVGVSVLRWTYVANKYETPYCSYDSYVNEMVKFIDAIVDKYQVNILLFPTNFPVNGCREDDVVVAKEIRSKCKNKEDVKCIKELPSAKEFKSLLSCSEVNVTTRMHACILSTSAHIPTMSINYLFKLKEYMDGIGLSDYSIDIEDFCCKDAFPMFELLWKNRLAIQEDLTQTFIEKKVDLEDSILKIKEL